MDEIFLSLSEYLHDISAQLKCGNVQMEFIHEVIHKLRYQKPIYLFLVRKYYELVLKETYKLEIQY
jgi:hypothetical protein